MFSARVQAIAQLLIDSGGCWLLMKHFQITPSNIKYIEDAKMAVLETIA